MRLWRIARQPYCKDRAGTGSKLYGGRWTPVGAPAIYAAGSIALAALEVLVQARTAPPDLVLVAIDIPDGAGVIEPERKDLPEDWASPLPSETCQAWGKKWLDAGKTLALPVPSVIIPEETNYLINVAHPRMKDVHLMPLRAFVFDLRLLR
jgi:RES domain-containing protein